MLRDVERIEKLGATLRAMRTAAEPAMTPAKEI
jgi:hypothetical protein